MAGSLGGRDAWEDGDAARRLKDREEELRRRREDETKVKRSIRCDLGVPSCGGAFTPSTRVVSRRRGRSDRFQ